MQTSNTVTKINRPKRNIKQSQSESDTKRKDIRNKRRNKMLMREVI